MAAFPKRYTIHFADLNPTIGGEIKKVRPVVRRQIDRLSPEKAAELRRVIAEMYGE